MTRHIDETTGVITVALPDDELARFMQLEAVVAGGLPQFVAVGNALMEIRDRQLYRADYDTFEAYCDQRWNIRRAQVYRLMDAAHVANVLSPIGDVPLNEAQARELASLDPEAMKVTYQLVKETAPDGKPTARHIRAVAEVVKEVMLSGAISNADGESVGVADALRAAITTEHYENMMRQLEHIAFNSKPAAWRGTVSIKDGWVEWGEVPPDGRYMVVFKEMKS